MKIDFDTVYVTYDVTTRSGETIQLHHELPLNASTADCLRQHIDLATGELVVSKHQPAWNFM